MGGLRNRRGIALPIVIFLVAVLSISLAAAFTLNGTELRVNDNHHEQLEAFAIAESGRQRFLASRDSLGFTAIPPAASESVRVSLSGGYADVVLGRIRPAVGTAPALYLLRSRGVRTGARMYGIPRAERTVAQLAYWRTGTMTSSRDGPASRV